jgi:hypothetical protein
MPAGLPVMRWMTAPRVASSGRAEEQGLGPSAWPSHVRPARGSVPPLGEHYPPLNMHINYNSHALLDEFIGHVML